MRRSKFIWLLIAFVFMNNTVAKSQAISQTEKMKWFQEAKYGMFYVWGLYSVPAGEYKGKKDYGEWIQFTANMTGAEYAKYADQFNPQKFNAKEWVSLAKEAGMKYFIVTAKFCDGFSMFDTKLSKFNIVEATPYKHDPLKDLAEECHKQGLPLCFYYCIKDWLHPDYPIEYTFRMKDHPDGYLSSPHPNADYIKYLDFMQGQLRELLTNYGDVSIIWFDFGLGFDVPKYNEKAKQIVAMIHELQPKCLINNRMGGVGADYGTPEQVIPGGVQQSSFEVCMTLNKFWGYNKNDKEWKSPKTVLRNLVDIVGKGGNYLLNVGPTADGVIPSKAKEILLKVGKWLEVNGESIYNAHSGVQEINYWWNEIDFLTTTKPGKIYLHFFQWPKDQKFFLDYIPTGFTKAYFLNDKNKTPLKIEYHNNHKNMMIILPVKSPDELDAVVVIELSGR